jgi:uncharacterized MAPEG superfamily protein
MTLPQHALLGFALWTLLVLAITVGWHRWSLILTGRAEIHTFAPEAPSGPDWYRRATRAHLNCIENLPVFGAIVFIITTIGLKGPLVDALCIATLAARVVQSCVHISHEQTNAFVAVRFSFYSVQLVSFLALIVMVVKQATLAS